MSTRAEYTTKSSVEVQILGQRFVLKTGGDTKHVERLVNYLQRKIDELSLSGPLPGAKLAVLAALNIADDYFKALDEARELKHQVAKKSRSLLQEIDHYSNQHLHAVVDDGPSSNGHGK
ncbi:MAG: cell division protein ZapA [Deltaproteobacteria bacterium]|nr:cell division protein ZapA [Deltaproteobacteria bacterium]